MVGVILGLVALATLIGLVAVLLAIRKRGTSQAGPVARAASMVHHVLTSLEIVAVVIVIALPATSLGLPADEPLAKSGLVFSGVFTAAVLAPSTVGMAAAMFLRSKVARTGLIAVLWLVTLGVLVLQAVALSNAW